MDIDELSRRLDEEHAERRRTIVPKLRAAIFRDGFAPFEQIRDQIVTEDELKAAGFTPGDPYSTRNWHRFQ